MNNRIHHVDWLRAFGICLVVYGHSLAVPTWLGKVIYSFHMPLFFFLSGYVMSKEKLQLPLSSYLKMQGKSIVKPYLVFAIIGYLTWFFVLRHFGKDVGETIPFQNPLIGILYGSGSRPDYLQPVVLWFFPCLFTSQLLLWGIEKFDWVTKVVIVLSSIGCGLLTKNLVLPWELETAFTAIFFVALGYELKQWKGYVSFMNRIPLVITFIGIMVAIYLAETNDSVDMRLSHFGNPIYFFAAAILFILSLLRISFNFQCNSLVSKISENTLAIFPLHNLSFAVISAIYVYVFKLPLSIRENGMVGLGATVLIVLVLTFLGPTILKLLGLQKK